MISTKRLRSRVCARPAASASSVLPLPAGPEQRDEIDLRIHQQIEREILLAVARGDAPDAVALAAKIARQLQRGRVAVHRAHDRLDALRAASS